MNLIDIFNLLAGFASLVSIAFVLHEKYSTWRKFTVPVTCIFAGFVLGRVAGGMAASSQSFQLTPLWAGIIVLVLILAVGVFAFTHLLNKGESDGAMFLMIMGFALVFVMALPILSMNAPPSSKISPADYLKLARMKEDDGDIDAAIRYLKEYSSQTDDSKAKEQIKSKISTLTQKQLQKELGASSKPTETP